MVNLRSVIAQVHRSIGSSSKKEVPTYTFGKSVMTGFGGWVSFLLYKDYKDNPTLWRTFFGMMKNSGHHEKVQVPKVKGRGKLLEDEMEKKNSG